MARKKEHLIAPEKSRNVIYLEKRGREKPNYLPAVIMGFLAFACVLYCLAIAMFIGYGTKFFLIWGVLGAFFAGLSYLLYRKDLCEMIPLWAKGLLLLLAGAALGVFVFTEVMILRGFRENREAPAEYMIVLGAQWRATGPSRVLKQRLDRAYDYLENHPQTMVIVSGGQGANEVISEAQGMAEYLIGRGIEAERILREDVSVNTNQNLVYSSVFLDKEKNSVIIVTNNFHVFRAVGIAKRLGYRKVSGLAAPSVEAMLPNNLLREFFGVWKDVICKNMSLW